MSGGLEELLLEFPFDHWENDNILAAFSEKNDIKWVVNFSLAI